VSNGLKINVKNPKRKKEEIDETNKKKKDVDVQAPEEIHIMYVFFLKFLFKNQKGGNYRLILCVFFSLKIIPFK